MKKRYNFTLEKETINILKQAIKLNGNSTSMSALIEFAVKKTFQNKAEHLREIAREKAKELTKLQEQIKELEAKK